MLFVRGLICEAGCKTGREDGEEDGEEGEEEGDEGNAEEEGEEEEEGEGGEENEGEENEGEEEGGEEAEEEEEQRHTVQQHTPSKVRINLHAQGISHHYPRITDHQKKKEKNKQQHHGRMAATPTYHAVQAAGIALFERLIWPVEFGGDAADLADGAFTDQVADGGRDGEEAGPDGFHHEEALGAGQVDQDLQLRGIDGERLLADHILARAQGQQAVLKVVRVRGGNVDGVEGCVGDQLVVAAVCGRGRGGDQALVQEPAGALGRF